MVKVKAAGFDAFITTNGGTASTPEPVKKIEVGSKVKLKTGAKTYTGGSIASFVFNSTHIVDELKGNRAVLDRKSICTPVNINDLILQ